MYSHFKVSEHYLDSLITGKGILQVQSTLFAHRAQEVEIVYPITWALINNLHCYCRQ
jgi:beta-N-acetylglucosaminidase